MQCPRCRTENREGRRFCGECGLSFGSVCERWQTEVHEHLRTAAEMYGETDMRFWLVRAEAELRKLE